jgi:hypothetical protein
MLTIIAHYSSGSSQTFVVPGEMTLADFINKAFEAGGHVKRLEFL